MTACEILQFLSVFEVGRAHLSPFRA